MWHLHWVQVLAFHIDFHIEDLDHSRHAGLRGSTPDRQAPPSLEYHTQHDYSKHAAHVPNDSFFSSPFFHT
jgi:hypothetical protein